MLVKPIVEELILAGPTRKLAIERFVRDEQDEQNDGLVVCGCPLVSIEGQWYTLGTIRICPPLKVAKRFRAFVTWLPSNR